MIGSAPSAATHDLARHTWQALRALVLEEGTRRRAVSDALGMSFGRIRALRSLASEPRTLSGLAAALQTDPPYTTVIVADLERRGLVTRRPHPDDRRRKIVQLTANGRHAADQAERILGTPPAGLLALRPDELSELDRLVRRALAAN